MSHAAVVETKPGELEFRLPDLGEGVMEGEIVRWLVAVGDTIAEDQNVVEIMTDKAAMEIPCPAGGTVAALFGKEGDIVPVGKALLTLKAAGAGHAPAGAPAPERLAPALPATEAAPGAKAEPPAAAVAPQASAPAAAPAGKALASPATRKLAREKGLDLAAVAATGPNGRVTRDDVLKAGAAPATAAPHAAPSRPAAQPLKVEGSVERIPLRGLRRKIAEKMVQSAYTAPHVTTFDELDMTALVALRARLKPKAEALGAKLSFMPFFMKAVTAALREFPLFNASLDPATQEIVVRHDIHLGFAAATDNGLMVPVVRHADTKGLVQLATEMQAIAERTRAGKAPLEELTGSTFTISNVGSVGGLFATPIINYPEVAILGVNQTQKRAVVRDGQVVVRDMMYLGLSFDHRVVDGSEAVRFLQAVIGYLEDPERLLLVM